jgi:hypothetical protein
MQVFADNANVIVHSPDTDEENGYFFVDLPSGYYVVNPAAEVPFFVGPFATIGEAGENFDVDPQDGEFILKVHMDRKPARPIFPARKTNGFNDGFAR